MTMHRRTTGRQATPSTEPFFRSLLGMEQFPGNQKEHGTAFQICIQPVLQKHETAA